MRPHKNFIFRIFQVVILMILITRAGLFAQDSWQGSYNLVINGVSSESAVQIRKTGEKRYSVTIAQGKAYDATETSSVLKGVDELGVEFVIRKSPPDLTLMISGMEFALTPVRQIPVTSQESKAPAGKDTIEFEGSYLVDFSGTVGKQRVNIRKSGSDRYVIEMNGQSEEGTRKGRSILISDQKGNQMEIKCSSGRYEMILQESITFEMTKENTAGKNSEGAVADGKNTQVDPQIVGTWQRSSSYSSGSGEYSFSIATIKEYRFAADGRFTYSSRSAGGTRDVGSDSGGQTESGVFHTETDRATGQSYLVVSGTKVPYRVMDGGRVLMLNEKSNLYQRVSNR